MTVYLRFPGQLQKAVTLSYDDGIRQDKRFIEIMNKYGLKGTFNINSGGMIEYSEDENKPNGKMCWAEMKKAYEGHEIALHALTHPFLEKLPKPVMVHEICNDRENIEREFKKVVRGMAYPYGTYNEDVIDVLDSCGVAYSRTTKSTLNFELPQRWLELHPTCHHANGELFNLIERFFNGEPNYPRAQMFYLWGHTYEFDRDVEFNNWEHAEQFCKALSGHSDVWYATNMEIYQYVQAYNRLEFSMDMTKVYNPTAFDISLAVGTGNMASQFKMFTVKPGETICF